MDVSARIGSDRIGSDRIGWEQRLTLRRLERVQRPRRDGVEDAEAVAVGVGEEAVEARVVPRRADHAESVAVAAAQHAVHRRHHAARRSPRRGQAPDGERRVAGARLQLIKLVGVGWLVR